MKTSMFRPLPLVAALCLSGLVAPAFAAEPVQLLAASPQDLVASRLVRPQAKALATAGLERAPVAMSWALDPAQALDARPQVHEAQSREYWIDASQGQIQNGVRLPLSKAGALVRISPHAGNAAIAADDVQLSFNGQRLDSRHAIAKAADADALHAAGMDVPDGSVILRLANDVPSGVKLAVPAASGACLVHVFEPDSAVVLSLKAGRDSIAGGDAISFRANIEGATLDRIGGLVSAPDGASQNVDFVRQADGSYVGSLTPDLAHASGPSLWELHAFGITAGKDGVPRDAKTAFAVSLPVARLDGRVTQPKASRNADLSLRIGVEANIASRYAISGVLYGSADDGSMRPVAMAQAAAWIAAGHGSIELRYDASSLSLHGPWEVRDLRLVNQADFSLQERRERALAWR